jgi:hypothetical protein
MTGEGTKMPMSSLLFNGRLEGIPAQEGNKNKYKMWFGKKK